MISTKISVGIPLYNAKDTLTKALDSISIQTMLPYEVIIIDDGSDCDYSEIISMYPNIRYIKQAHAGKVGSIRNVILDNCSTDYLIMLDADDILLHPLLIEESEWLIQNKKPVLIEYSFVEQLKTGRYAVIERTQAWCHGKIYNVKALRFMSLRFAECRTHEELAVNIPIYELLPARIARVSTPAYLWKYHSSSITRAPDDYLYEAFDDYLCSLFQAQESIARLDKGSTSQHAFIRAVLSAYCYIELMKDKHGMTAKIMAYEKILHDEIRNRKEVIAAILEKHQVFGVPFDTFYMDVKSTQRVLYPHNKINVDIAAFIRTVQSEVIL